MFAVGSQPSSGSALPPSRTREGGAAGDSVALEMQEVSKGGDKVTLYGSSAGVEDESAGDFAVPADQGDHSRSGFRKKLHYIFVEKDPLLCRISKWVFATLLALFLAAIIFGIFYSGLRTHVNDETVESSSSCDTAFGSILGSHNGVMGFSNCNADHVSWSMYSIPLPVHASNGSLTSQQVFVGMMWQCVEYARRYWMLAGSPEPAYFGDVDGAADIWHLREVTVVRDMSTTRRLHAFPNGASILSGGSAPKVRDLLIYPRQLGDEFPAGHVAVIVQVALDGARGEVYVAEQNWNSRVWAAPFYNYSRTIPLSYNSETLAYTISDPDGAINGWMRYA